MAVTYEEFNPSPIENATVRIGFLDGVPRTYYIKANDGYVLHDQLLDEAEYDPETYEETGNILLGYSEGTKSCGINYDWDENPREFYAVLKSTVPENPKLGGSNKNHETM
jgi:hypothetical protein